MKITLLAVGYFISLIPPVVIACAMAAVAGALVYLFLFPHPQPQPVRNVARQRNQRIYTNTTPVYHGRRWPTAVGCMA